MIRVKTIGQTLPFKSGTALPSPSQATGSHFSYSVSGAIRPSNSAPPSIEVFLKNSKVV